jgi:hypothetical protein
MDVRDGDEARMMCAVDDQMKSMTSRSESEDTLCLRLHGPAHEVYPAFFFLCPFQESSSHSSWTDVCEIFPKFGPLLDTRWTQNKP